MPRRRRFEAAPRPAAAAAAAPAVPASVAVKVEAGAGEVHRLLLEGRALLDLALLAKAVSGCCKRAPGSFHLAFAAPLPMGCPLLLHSTADLRLVFEEARKADVRLRFALLDLQVSLPVTATAAFEALRSAEAEAEERKSADSAEPDSEPEAKRVTADSPAESAVPTLPTLPAMPTAEESLPLAAAARDPTSAADENVSRIELAVQQLKDDLQALTRDSEQRFTERLAPLAESSKLVAELLPELRRSVSESRKTVQTVLAEWQESQAQMTSLRSTVASLEEKVLQMAALMQAKSLQEAETEAEKKQDEAGAQMAESLVVVKPEPESAPPVEPEAAAATAPAPAPAVALSVSSSSSVVPPAQSDVAASAASAPSVEPRPAAAAPPVALAASELVLPQAQQAGADEFELVENQQEILCLEKLHEAGLSPLKDEMYLHLLRVLNWDVDQVIAKLQRKAH